jgi:hypothetical protein
LPTYSLDLQGPEGVRYVPTHDFPEPVRRGDTFTYDGWTWQVTEVAAKQEAVPDEPDYTLRCLGV